MHVSPATWITRALWLAIPFTLGGLIGDALSGHPGATASTMAAWGLWALGLFASVVLLPTSLTLLRTIAPLPLLGGVLAALRVDPTTLGWVGLAVAGVAAVAAMAAEVGADFVDGSSYGDEQRVALRAPAVLLLGPIEAVWVLTAVPLPVAVLLACSGRWVAAGAVAVVGAALAVVGFRILHRLAVRWLVLVPAGVTIVDRMALAEPILLRRSDIVRLGPAPADTAAVDLTVGATGLIVQADLSTPVELVRATRRGATGVPIEVTSLLVAPSRPGRLLAIAEERRIVVGRS
ncbi:MAG: hypothetical protein JST64_04430 [Actinobacteria bacterium]|nr:hypothetical protein [Actinomycetota bacterium]